MLFFGALLAGAEVLVVVVVVCAFGVVVINCGGGCSCGAAVIDVVEARFVGAKVVAGAVTYDNVEVDAVVVERDWSC